MKPLCSMLAALALASMALAAPASATIDLEQFGYVGGSFSLHGSHGFTIGVTGYATEEGGRGGISVVVYRRGATAYYSAPAKVAGDSIVADLGGLGKIDVTLNRSGHKRVVRSRCLRDSIEYEPGVFEGTIRFRGEGGYTRVDAASAPLRVPLPLGDCGGGGKGEVRGANVPGARLRGVSYAHGRFLEFSFHKNAPGAKVLFEASVRERRGDVRISRSVQGFAGSRAFRFAGNLSAANLRPPAPFSGHATLWRPPNSVNANLRGNLEIAFPGRTIALTGPDVPVSLVHARYTRSDTSEVSIGF